MNKIANRQTVCNVLTQKAETDRDIVVLCSDSRGSASMGNYVAAHPDRFVETGIAEQNCVSIAAGLASCGMKPYVASPACFLSTRSMEQVKVDVAYSHTNVKLVGISGGISYGALGMTHHSINDIAALGSLPNMRVYLPSDRLQTEVLFETLLQDEEPAYIRIGRNAVEDVYAEGSVPFVLNRATTVAEGRDLTVIACGEMVKPAQEAAEFLKKLGISCRVLDMYCVKPIDRQAVLAAAEETGTIITVEEHTAFGGLGASVSQIVAAEHPTRVVSLTLPDEPVIAGNSKEVFAFYGLTAQHIAETAQRLIS